MRITSIRNAALVGALLALAGGGAALAGTPNGHVMSRVAVQKAAVSTAAEPVEAADTDNVQEGDQTTPDAAPAAAKAPAIQLKSIKAAPHRTAKAAASDTGTETDSETEAASETGTETEAANDGPGGHADDPNDPNADYQFEGEE